MRRRELATAIAAGALAIALPASAGPDLAPRAARFIEATAAEVLEIINGPGSLEERREKLAQILRRTVDVRGVAQFVLGRHWRTASEAQRNEYLALFEQVLVRNLSARFGEFAGVTVTVARNQMVSDEEALVSTVVSRPNAPPVTLDWRVAEIDGTPRIVDVVAEGTSLRITQRSEYGAVVQRSGGLEGLLRAMRQQLAQLEQGEARR